MAFDIAGAKKAGYSDSEIADHLAQDENFDIDAARKSGYSDSEILTHLSESQPGSAAPEQKVDYKAREVAQKEADQAYQESKSAGRNLDALTTAANAMKGVAAGGYALAGLPVKTVSDTIDLGKAGLGYGYNKLTGNPIPEALQLQPRNEIMGTPENLMQNLSPSDLSREGDSMTQKFVYGVGGSVIPALATKNIGAAPMSAAKALSYGSAAGVGSVLGGEVARQSGGGESAQNFGSILGGLALPLAGGAAARSISNTADNVQKVARQVVKPADEMANTLAADKLKDTMIRAGQTQNQAVAGVASRGPEATLADTSPTLGSLLGVAGRENSRVAGDVRAQLYGRHSGQSQRLSSGVTGGGLQVDDVIAQIEAETKPRIKEAYQRAESELSGYGGQLPPTISNFLDGESSIGKASQKINQQLIDAREAGIGGTPFDRINATKQVLDDEIAKLYREGANNEARVKVALKNKFLQAADDAMPSFKEARNLYAGKAQLEEAAKNGELIFKIPVSDVKAYVNGLSESEKAMHILGGQKAALARLEDAAIVSDASKKLLGRNGDIERLKVLFPDEAAYNKFRNTLRTEADFLSTKRQFEGSQTAERLTAQSSNAIDSVSTIGIAKKLLGNLGKEKSEKSRDLAYQKLGDLLAKPNLTAEELMTFLSKATKESPERAPFIQRAGDKTAQAAFTSSILSGEKPKKSESK